MKRSVVTILGLFGAVVVFALSHYSPATAHWYPPCILKKIAGLDCPGCGGTRACQQLIQGHLGEAADLNLLLLFMFPVAAIGVAAQNVKQAKRIWKYFNKPMTILVVVLLFWLIRNLPIPPFDWLHSDK